MLLIAVAVAGLLFGSFLNVVVHRLPRMYAECPEQGYNLLYPRSHCPHCRVPLLWRDMIPIISFFFRKGRCRYCRIRIGAQYPIIEILTAGTAVFAYVLFDPLHAVAAVVCAAFCYVIAAIDIRIFRIFDVLSLGLLWCGLLAATIFDFSPSPTASIAGAVFGYSLLWSLYRIHRFLTGIDGMGYGDFKLLAALGAWFGIGAVLPIVFIASVIGIGCFAVIARIRSCNRYTQLPFGPCLVSAGLGWLFFSDTVMRMLP